MTVDSRDISILDGLLFSYNEIKFRSLSYKISEPLIEIRNLDLFFEKDL